MKNGADNKVCMIFGIVLFKNYFGISIIAFLIDFLLDLNLSVMVAKIRFGTLHIVCLFLLQLIASSNTWKDHGSR